MKNGVTRKMGPKTEQKLVLKYFRAFLLQWKD